MTRRLTLLLAALGTAAALLAPSPSASAAPVITVAPALDPSYPIQVPQVATGATTRITVTVSSTEPVSAATATADNPDGGLVVADPVQPLGTLSAPTTVSFDVAGASPGLHTLFVLVSASGGAVGGTILRYVWTNGSPLPPTRPGRQQPRSLGWQGTEQVAGSESPSRAVRMLTFVSKDQVFIGLPAFGVPTCAQGGDGCVSYALHPNGGPLQIGTGIIARGHQTGLYTDGFVPPDPQAGEVFGRYDFKGSLDPSSPRSRPHGTYRYTSRERPDGLTYQKVSFEKDGTYRLAYARDGGEVRRFAGRFRLGSRGAITFRADGRVVQRGTLLVVQRTPPRLGPFEKGVWLILSGRRGKHPDGNLLRLVG